VGENKTEEASMMMMRMIVRDAVKTDWIKDKR